MTSPLLDGTLMNVKSCCYGLTSLRIGTIIIFGLTLIFSILQLSGWFLPSLTVELPAYVNVKSFPPILDYYTALYALLGIIVSICGFAGQCGVFTRRSSSLPPYIIVTAVETVLLWTVMVFGLVFLHSEKQCYYNALPTVKFVISKGNIDDIDSAFNSLIVWILFGGLVFSVINWYCTSVVYSYFEAELESEKQSDHGSAPRQNMMLNSIP